MNGIFKSLLVSTPFVLSLSKDSATVFTKQLRMNDIGGLAHAIRHI